MRSLIHVSSLYYYYSYSYRAGAKVLESGMLSGVGVELR